MLLLAVVLALGLSACDDKPSNSEYDQNATYSEITEELELSLDYQGKSFLKDGIGLAVLRFPTDGDTAAFIVDGDKTIRVRFFGIDTPESTGQVDKWGKSASLFTKHVLETASEIVLESSTGKAAVTDSYGERYLGYVWYRTSETDSWKNLNLLLVENGYSPNNCVNTIEYKYYSYFDRAYKFAYKARLHLWGNAEDPNYSDKPVQLTIKELIEGIEIYYNKEHETGAKVTIEATIIDLYIAKSGTYTFTAAQVIDGVEYTYSIYAGYANATIANYLKIGNKYCMTGFVQLYSGNYQISRLTYVVAQQGADHTYLMQESDYLIFDSSVEYKAYYRKNLKTDATVKNATLNGTTLTLTVETNTVKKDGIYDAVETYTITTQVAADFDVNSVLNKKISGGVYRSEDNKYYALNINALSFK